MTEGFYIDIGAQDPIVDSVSKVFYEHGWRGIHVEPTPHYAELLRQQRPNDVVIQAAVGTTHGVIQFFEIPGTGISTADQGIAARHRSHGIKVREITVPAVTLAAIFEAADSPDIHWLKIDVEGLELQVLSSWGASDARPWILVVESTLPNTTIETHDTWELIVIAKGYVPVYFDGLNRFYISESHPELRAAFGTPPNIFDEFALSGTANAPFHRLIESNYRQEVDEARATADAEISRVTARVASSEKMVSDGLFAIDSLESRLKISEEIQQKLRLSSSIRERDLERENKDLHSQLALASQQASAREREISADMLGIWRRSMDDKAEQIRAHDKLQNEIASAVNHKDEEIELVRRQLNSAQNDFLQRYAELRDSEHKLHESLLSEQRARDRTLLNDLELARNRAQALEHQLKDEVRKKEETTEAARLEIGRLRSQLSSLQDTFLWRMSNVFRRSRRPEELTSLSISGAPNQGLTYGSSAPSSLAATSVSIEDLSVESNSPVRANVRERLQMKEASSLRALLNLRGEQFVDCAYLTILRRDSDDAGRAHYVQRLSLGDSKESVIYSLCTSEEAKQRGVSIPWLRRLIVLHKLSALPLIGVFKKLSSKTRALNELEFRVSNLEKRANFTAIQSLAGSQADEPATSQGPSVESEALHLDDASIGPEIDPSEIPLVAKRVRKALAEAIASQ